MRELWQAREPADWSVSHVEHREHEPAASAAALVSTVSLDEIVRRVNAMHLDPPVRVYLPSDRQTFWRVRSETQNRPRVRELELDVRTGAVLRDQRFADKPLLDRIVGVGVAAHEGQLFGMANQLLGLATTLGLITLCVSAIMMWWRRRPDGSLGIPAPRVAEFRIKPALGAAIVALGAFLPVFGASLVCVALLDFVARRNQA
jgi:uncharacterized iron-regulated membrane protein